MSSADSARNEPRALARALATSCGLGEILPAPGTTAGSFPATIVWAALWMVTPLWLTFSASAVMVVGVTVVGVWAAGCHSRVVGLEDPGPVVIDEVAGQWVTFLVALAFLPASPWGGKLVVVAEGFVVFRIFDVLKPWPVRQLERLSGGLGIVADDIAAGVYAGALLAVISRWPFH